MRGGYCCLARHRSPPEGNRPCSHEPAPETRQLGSGAAECGDAVGGPGLLRGNVKRNELPLVVDSNAISPSSSRVSPCTSSCPCPMSVLLRGWRPKPTPSSSTDRRSWLLSAARRTR